jgi:nucleoside-diphosphate-sugar epimerase
MTHGSQQDNVPKVALVVGAGGIIGHAVAQELLAQGWATRGLGRRQIVDIPSIAVDLTDASATVKALAAARETTHVFYAALSPDPDLSVEAARNALMLGNLLDGLEKVGAPLQRVVIIKASKYMVFTSVQKLERRRAKVTRRTCRRISILRRSSSFGNAQSAAPGTM